MWNDKSGIIDNPRARDKNNPKCYSVSKNGKPSTTYFSLQKNFRHCSSVLFYPKTGRTHQIRVHCAHIGHPIVGDPIYSRCRKLPLDLPGQTLHAVQLGLDHPLTGERMVFDAPLPDLFEKLLAVLRRRTGTASVRRNM